MQKKEEEKYTKFIFVLKKLSLNILLLEALDPTPGYIGFIKDLLMKKRVVNYEYIDRLHYFREIAS